MLRWSVRQWLAVLCLLCTVCCALSLNDDAQADAPEHAAVDSAPAADSPPADAAARGAEDAPAPAVASTGDGRPTIWEAHYWLFMIILIFICICAFIVLLCGIWLCCRRARKRRHTMDVEALPHKKEPATPSAAYEPLIAQKSAQPAMAELPPAQQPPPPAEDENGWIIPMDQLTQEELDQTEPPVSKL